MNQHPETVCPFCSKAVASIAQECSNCGKSFPWNSRFNILDDKIKERETSRIRAAVTIAQEMASGRPPSRSAIIGLVTAWLLPRTVIVLGSIIGGAILVLQTFLLYNQTAIARNQTMLSVFESEDRTEQAMADILASLSELEILNDAFDDMKIYLDYLQKSNQYYKNCNDKRLTVMMTDQFSNFDKGTTCKFIFMTVNSELSRLKDALAKFSTNELSIHPEKNKSFKFLFENFMMGLSGKCLTLPRNNQDTINNVIEFYGMVEVSSSMSIENTIINTIKKSNIDSFEKYISELQQFNRSSLLADYHMKNKNSVFWEYESLYDFVTSISIANNYSRNRIMKVYKSCSVVYEAKRKNLEIEREMIK